MKSYSTSEAARKLGLHPSSLARYVAAKKVPAPKVVITGTTTTHIWSEEEIEQVRKVLPKIANGRKTRYQKLREKQGKTPARAPVPHDKRKTKRKK